MDERLLQALIGREAPEIPRHVGVLTLPQTHYVYAPSSVNQLTGFSGNHTRIAFEIWEEDGPMHLRESFAISIEGPLLKQPTE